METYSRVVEADAPLLASVVEDDAEGTCDGDQNLVEAPMGVAAALASRRDAVKVVHALDRKGDVALALHERQRAAWILDGPECDQPAVVNRRLRDQRRTFPFSFHLRSLMRNVGLCTPSVRAISVELAGRHAARARSRRPVADFYAEVKALLGEAAVL